MDPVGVVLLLTALFVQVAGLLAVLAILSRILNALEQDHHLAGKMNMEINLHLTTLLVVGKVVKVVPALHLIKTPPVL